MMTMYWLRAKIHPTWQVTTICGAFILGVACARFYPNLGSWCWLALGVLMSLLAIWKSRRMLLVAACMGGLVLGLYRGSIDQADLVQYAPYIGKAVTLRGVIDGDVGLAKGQTYALQLKNVRIGARELTGVVYVSTGSEGATLRRSDNVTITGVLQHGFGNFAASMYRALLVGAERPQPGDVALQVRDAFADRVREAVHEPAASLGVGFLLGQKSALPPQLVEDLQVAGLTHIVVASGYNLMILVRLARRLFEKTSRYLATVASGTLIIGFIAMTGMTPSMTRAGLVAGLGLAAWYVGRKFHPVTLLVFSAAVTVVIDPSNVWGNVGWMLSFAAFAGVMIVAPILTAYFFGKEKVPFVAQLLIETISAQLVTLPIIASVFGTVSIISLLANILVLPLIPFAMLLVFVVGIAGFIAPFLSSIVAWPAQQLLDLITNVINWCASVPGAQINWQMAWPVVVAEYGIVILGCFYMKWRSGYRLYSASIVE